MYIFMIHVFGIYFKNMWSTCQIISFNDEKNEVIITWFRADILPHGMEFQPCISNQLPRFLILGKLFIFLTLVSSSVKKRLCQKLTTY
jgi:hypothetical protein